MAKHFAWRLLTALLGMEKTRGVDTASAHCLSVSLIGRPPFDFAPVMHAFLLMEQDRRLRARSSAVRRRLEASSFLLRAELAYHQASERRAP